MFGSQDPLDDSSVARLTSEVDRHLAQWRAHGDPLTCGRDVRENRFLTIAVDQSTAGASGCSIDGLFRTLQGLESVLGTTLVGGGRIYFRDATGEIRAVSHADFSELAASGEIGPETIVFDTTVATLAEWYDHFETTAKQSWHSRLIPAPRAG